MSNQTINSSFTSKRSSNDTTQFFFKDGEFEKIIASLRNNTRKVKSTNSTTLFDDFNVSTEQLLTEDSGFERIIDHFSLRNDYEQFKSTNSITKEYSSYVNYIDKNKNKNYHVEKFPLYLDKLLKLYSLLYTDKSDEMKMLLNSVETLPDWRDECTNIYDLLSDLFFDRDDYERSPKNLTTQSETYDLNIYDYLQNTESQINLITMFEEQLTPNVKIRADIECLKKLLHIGKILHMIGIKVIILCTDIKISSTNQLYYQHTPYSFINKYEQIINSLPNLEHNIISIYLDDMHLY